MGAYLVTPTGAPPAPPPFQSLALTASTPVRLALPGAAQLYILNTGPGNLYVSAGNTPGANAASLMIPPLKSMTFGATAGSLWVASDQNGGASVAVLRN
jgi:hypothetical protein